MLDSPRQIWLCAKDQKEGGLSWLREARLSYCDALALLRRCESKLAEASCEGCEVEPTLGIVTNEIESVEATIGILVDLARWLIGPPRPAPSEESYLTSDMEWAE